MFWHEVAMKYILHMSRLKSIFSTLHLHQLKYTINKQMLLKHLLKYTSIKITYDWGLPFCCHPADNHAIE